MALQARSVSARALRRLAGWTLAGLGASVLLSAPALACAGDCNGDGEVTVNELITMVNIALDNQPISACTAGDQDGDGMIAINEIIAGVNKALNGCTQ